MSNYVSWGEVLFSEEDIANEEWREVGEDYPGLYVSSLGRARREFDGKIRLMKPGKSKTTNGYYYTIHPKRANSDVVSQPAMHRLVALTFLDVPPSDGRRYEVNHIDGDKLNNRKENLEWVTRSENVKHAFNTGLNKHSISVSRIDVITGERVEYVSVLDCARSNGIKHHDVKWLSYTPPNVMFKERYRFELHRSDSVVPIHPITKTVIGKDYRTGNVYVCSTAGQLSHLIPVDEYKISRYCRVGRRTLVNGCLVMYLDDHAYWPEFSQEEIDESVAFDEYHRKVRLHKAIMKRSDVSLLVE